MKKPLIKKIAMILVLIGALNWGLVGVGLFFGSNYDLVDYIAYTLGIDMLAMVVYVLVGLSGIYLLLCSKAMCKMMKRSNNHGGY